MTKGIFISFEGPDGAGKTTVLEAILPQLKNLLQRGYHNTRTRWCCYCRKYSGSYS